MRKYLYAMMGAISISVAIVTPAQAYFYNASDLLEGAREALKYNQGARVDSYDEMGQFRSFVVAVHDISSLEGLICTPRGAIVGQTSTLAASWVVNNPQDWSRPAAYVVFEALLHHFPCVEQE